MIVVELSTSWFAPTDVIEKPMQKVRGRLYGAGVHEMPEFLRDYLPEHAKILKDKTIQEYEGRQEPEPEEAPMALSEYDDVRKGEEAVQAKVEADMVAAEEPVKRKRGRPRKNPV